MYNPTAYTEVLNESGGGMTLKAWVSATKDALVVDVTGADPNAQQSATVSLWSGRSPQAAVSGGTGTLAETWVDNQEAGNSGRTFGSLAAITAGGRNVTVSVVNSTSVKTTFTANTDGSYRVIVGSPTWTGGNAATTAAGLLGSDATAAESSLLSSQQSWCANYWANTGVLEANSGDGQAQYMEPLRTVYLFMAAASMRGTIPGSPNWNALDITSGAEISLYVWQQYQDTGDLNFLRTYYPLMRDSGVFLLAYQQVGSDGNLHAVATALDEALVQDYDGLLRIAPAWPAGWDASGTVSVQGNTKVDVQVQGGTPVTVAIQAGSSATMRVRSPWPGQSVQVVNGSSGAVVVSPTTAGTLNVPVTAGQSYLVEPVSNLTTSLPFAQVSGSPATAARHLGNVQVGLDAGPSTGGGTQVLSLRAHANGQYVCADNAGASPLIANRTSVGQRETFDLVDQGGGYFALKAHANSKWVTADNAGAAPLLAKVDSVGTWEQFQVIHNGDGSVSLKSRINNDYVTAESAGAQPLVANRTSIGPWEEFDLIND